MVTAPAEEDEGAPALPTTATARAATTAKSIPILRADGTKSANARIDTAAAAVGKAAAAVAEKVAVAAAKVAAAAGSDAQIGSGTVTVAAAAIVPEDVMGDATEEGRVATMPGAGLRDGAVAISLRIAAVAEGEDGKVAAADLAEMISTRRCAAREGGARRRLPRNASLPPI